MGSGEQVLNELRALADEAEHAKIAKRVPADQVIGVRMKYVFDLAKANTELPLSEVEALLDSQYYEARMVAVSVLDFRTRTRGVTDEQRRELFELYLRRHDRIDTWDLVDRAAPRVIGWYLADKPPTCSSNLPGRRTSGNGARRSPPRSG